MKKKLIAGFVAAMAVAIGLGSYLFFRVEAQGVLTGLEGKVTDKVNKNEKFQIVEIVPDGGLGEIGCLVNKADQDLVQQYMNTYITSYLQANNAKQNTKEVREECVKKLQSAYAYAIGDTNKPMTMTQGYEEAYFPTDTKNWKTLEFSSKENYEQARLKGTYVADTEGKGAYEMNIQRFAYYKEVSGCYKVTFGNTMRQDTGIYKQPYHVQKDTEGNQVVVDDTLIMDVAGDDETTDLWYIQSYEYKGAEDSEALYTAIPDSKKPYYYVGENGTYNFIMDESLIETDVQIGRIYYKFGLENHDWFRTKVLASKDSGSLDIEVSTIPESELSKDENAEKIEKADFIYVCGDMEKSGKTYQDAAKVWSAIGTAVSEQKVPCMIDASTKVWEQCGTYKDGYSGQADYVKENVYIYGSQKPEERQAFFENFEEKIADVSGLGEVESLVQQENLLRSGDEKLSTDLTRAFLLQYIIDYSRQRKLGVKDNLRVLEVEPCDTYDKDASGFELTEEVISNWTGTKKENITIERMSSATFIGKLNDLNKDYDLIYFGANISNFNTENGMGKKTVYNDSNMDGLIYAHTGDYVLANMYLTGSLDTDYAGAYYKKYIEGLSSPQPYSKETHALLYNNDEKELYTFLKNRTIIKNGILTQELKNESLRTYYQVLDPIIEHRDVYGDLGVYRYSGNDITKTKLEEVLEFVQANYPIIIADTYFNADGSINTVTVDNTSYVYQLFNEIKSYDNVFTVSEVGNTDNELSAYINIPKPELLYYDPQLPENLVKYNGIQTVAGERYIDSSTMRVDSSHSAQTGTYTLQLYFYIGSQVDASAQTVYVPIFYMDLNGDGIFLKGSDENTEVVRNTIIRNVDLEGMPEAQKKGNDYQLFSKTHYLLEIEIPATYLGVLTWKLEVVQQSNNYIRTSDIQYKKIDGIGTEEVVEVLQITNAKSAKDNTVDLKTDPKFQNYFEKIQQTTGLSFKFTTIDGNSFAKQSAVSEQEFYDNYLAQYDMLILGFGDMYYSFSDKNHALGAIQLFVDYGKSVLFTHDTTSFINIVPEEDGGNFDDINYSGAFHFWNPGTADASWGYYISQKFRSSLAMDRYGITAASTASVELKNQSALLCQGQHLTVNTKTREATVNKCIIYSYKGEPWNLWAGTVKSSKEDYFLTRDISEGKLDNNRDVAYAANTNDGTMAQSYAQTQGFTYGVLNQFRNSKGYTQNNGKPYYNFKDENMTGTDGSNGQAKAKVTGVNDGIITHYPYEIGSEFTAAETHYQYYQLHMDQDDNGDGRGDVSVWYCISDDADGSIVGKTYRNSKNDVRNNYYIYNIGNVTYTGMGHSALNHSGSDLETKLFINTIVAAYKAGVENPNIKILETSEKSSSEKKYEYITYDAAVSGTALTNDVDFYFTISDPNLTPSQKTMTVKFTYNNGTEDVALDASQLEVVDVTTNTPVTGNYTDGHVYKATLKDAAGKLAETGNGSLEIKAKLNSSFDYYGRHESHDKETSLTILKMSLFELN